MGSARYYSALGGDGRRAEATSDNIITFQHPKSQKYSKEAQRRLNSGLNKRNVTTYNFISGKENKPRPDRYGKKVAISTAISPACYSQNVSPVRQPEIISPNQPTVAR